MTRERVKAYMQRIPTYPRLSLWSDYSPCLPRKNPPSTSLPVLAADDLSNFEGNNDLS